MTQEEFNKTRWSRGMVIYHAPTEKTFRVLAVDFGEALIGVEAAEFMDIVSEDDYFSIQWLRCENCKILNPGMIKHDLIEKYHLTGEEVARLDFTYGNAWWKKQPEMYIGMVRRAMEEHTCPICGCDVDASTWEDYRMCKRCNEREHDD